VRRLMIGVVVAGSLVAALAVVGAVRLSRLLTGSARDQRSDLLLLAQDVGAEALPIVSLISSLVGVILAYVGAVEPQAFAAQVYVADLVGVAITRETGAMAMGVVMQWSPRSCARIRPRIELRDLDIRRPAPLP
jgi:phospholipid/cholesterol/gamma-HCH transport system permease protein